MASEMVTLPAAAIPDLRRMLAIGLFAYGEIERLQDQHKLQGGAEPIHPTGAFEASAFAEALLLLDQAEPVLEAAA